MRRSESSNVQGAQVHGCGSSAEGDRALEPRSESCRESRGLGVAPVIGRRKQQRQVLELDGPQMGDAPRVLRAALWTLGEEPQVPGLSGPNTSLQVCCMAKSPEQRG